MNELGDTVKVRRELLGLSQRALAAELKVQASHVSLLERGLRKPSIALLERLADALVVDRRELLALAHPTLLKTDHAKSPRQPKPASSLERPAGTSTGVLLKRYRITKDELRAIVAIITLIRDVSRPVIRPDRRAPARSLHR